MLGTGLGKKVDAQFVKEEYKTFLIGGNEKPKKPLTKEEKRAEWRKKGIFVAADDEDFVPTIFERPSTSLRPAVCKEKTKQLRWKKKTVRQVNKKPSDISIKTPDTSADSSSKQTNSVVATKEKKKKPKKNSELTKREISKKGYESLAENKGEGSKNEKKKKKWGEEEQKVSLNPKRSLREELNVTTARSSIVIEESPTQCQSVSVPEPSPSSSSSVTGALSIQEDCPTAKEMVSTATENSAPKSSNASNSLSYTLRQPVQMATTPVEKDDVFGKMEDDEFEKVLAQEKASFAVADKEAVMTARKILQVAYKEKAFEKALTKEENDILVQFFSGKIPYNDKVLKTLDKALDKTIDWMKTNKVKMTDETKALINKRSAVKAAMFEAILTSPQYIPKSWAKKYEELRAQSRKETQGINWARVLLCYPNQKMFGDGPEDQFGNFTRQKRNWILGILIGPSDSKTFEETQREEDCKGMYFDTGIMEKAKKHADEDVSTMTAVSSMMKR